MQHKTYHIYWSNTLYRKSQHLQNIHMQLYFLHKPKTRFVHQNHHLNLYHRRNLYFAPSFDKNNLSMFCVSSCSNDTPFFVNIIPNISFTKCYIFITSSISNNSLKSLVVPHARFIIDLDCSLCMHVHIFVCLE